MEFSIPIMAAVTLGAVYAFMMLIGLLIMCMRGRSGSSAVEESEPLAKVDWVRRVSSRRHRSASDYPDVSVFRHVFDRKDDSVRKKVLGSVRIVI